MATDLGHLHKVRTRRGLAYVAELWHARDAIAARLDRAPGRILPDSGITDLAALAVDGHRPDPTLLRRIPGFARRQARPFDTDWTAAMGRAAARRETDLPVMHLPTEGPPQARMWAAKDPVAAARLSRMRAALVEIAGEIVVPVENLLTPDYVRRVAWRPPSALSEESVNAALRELGARKWQRDLTVPQLTAALVG